MLDANMLKMLEMMNLIVLQQVVEQKEALVTEALHLVVNQMD